MICYIVIRNKDYKNICILQFVGCTCTRAFQCFEVQLLILLNRFFMTVSVIFPKFADDSMRFRDLTNDLISLFDSNNILGQFWLVTTGIIRVWRIKVQTMSELSTWIHSGFCFHTNMYQGFLHYISKITELSCASAQSLMDSLPCCYTKTHFI